MAFIDGSWVPGSFCEGIDGLIRNKNKKVCIVIARFIETYDIIGAEIEDLRLVVEFKNNYFSSNTPW